MESLSCSDPCFGSWSDGILRRWWRESWACCWWTSVVAANWPRDVFDGIRKGLASSHVMRLAPIQRRCNAGLSFFISQSSTITVDLSTRQCSGLVKLLPPSGASREAESRVFWVSETEASDAGTTWVTSCLP